ncbi:MAG: FAD-dependent monooxygenase [Chloroflexota bacterium]
MDVLISGAGIAGLTLALCLGRRGHRPLVVERTPALRGGGYMIDFYGPGFDSAETLGLLPEFEAIHYPIRRLAFLNRRGREKFSLAYRTLRHTMFDDRHFNFLRGDLERLLYSHAGPLADLRFGTSVTSLSQDAAGVDVELSDGSRHRVDACIGADGVHSQVRTLIFGPESRFSRFLGYYTAAAMLDGAAIDLDRDAFHTLSVPGRQVAVYPVRDGRIATFFAHRARRKLTDHSPETARAALRAVYGKMDWIVPTLVERSVESPDLYFDAVTQIEMPSWGRGRVGLVGDACGCVSLLAGQGASMAMTGAVTLAEELTRPGLGVEAAIRAYESRIRPAVLKRQAAGRDMANWFVPASRWRLALRDLFMRTSLWPGVDRLIKQTLASGAKL